MSNVKKIFDLNEFTPVQLSHRHAGPTIPYLKINKPCYVDIELNGVIRQKALFVHMNDRYDILYNVDEDGDDDIRNDVNPNLGYNARYTLGYSVIEKNKLNSITTYYELISKVYDEPVDPDFFKIIINIRKDGTLDFKIRNGFYGSPTDMFSQRSHPDCCGVNILFNFQNNNDTFMHDENNQKLFEKMFPLLLSGRAPKIIHLACYQKKSQAMVKKWGGIPTYSYKNPNSGNTITVYHLNNSNITEVKNLKLYGKN